METFLGEEIRAIEIAGDLARRFGGEAWGEAEYRRTEAVAATDIGRADLYRAVCTIIADRGGVFSGLRRKA